MRSGREFTGRLLALFTLCVAPVALAAEGIVVNEKQAPIEGARVCYFVDNIELICSLTDGRGRFELPASKSDTIRAHAEGYNPRTFSLAAQHGPVVLKRAPALKVRLLDAGSGEGVDKGSVLVIYPTGKEYGPFPVNKAGLQIRRGLTAGEIRVVGQAEGYAKSDPVAVTLEPGEQSDVKIELVAVKPE